MATQVASYFDGSGNYDVTKDGSVLTIALSDSDGEVMETFRFGLFRDTFYDGLDFSEVRLTENFAFDEDDAVCEIAGETYRTVLLAE